MMPKVECRFCRISWEIDSMIDLADILDTDCHIRPRGAKHEVRGIL